MMGQTAAASPPSPDLPWWLKLLFPSVLIWLAGWLAWLNHVPGTWLTGWDTLHPEFNFWLNLQRVLLGLFRTDQGLGTIATHAHYVELPRILLLWIGSWVVPLNLLRYLYISLCLILGPLGVYVLMNKILRYRYRPLVASAGAFAAGIWYLFNLGTLQHFVVPFEMFPTNYAAMGWTFWLLLQYLEKPRRSWLLGWAGAQFFASNMAYSFISWYVYFAAIIGFGSLYAILVWFQQKRNLVKPLLAVSSVLVLVNAYWLFPNWYFVANNSWHVPFAKNNQLISEEIYFHNKEYGTLLDTITMQNHLFNWRIRDESGEFVLLLEDMQAHLDSGAVYVPLAFFGVILLGYLVAVGRLFRNKPDKLDPITLSMFPIMLGGMLAFLSLNPPFEYLIAPIRESVSVIKEGLRNPFIKINMVLLFSYAVGFGLGISWIINLLAKAIKSRTAAVLTSLSGVVILALFLGWPFFQGHLIDTRMQQEIPEEYFQMFEWFQQQPTAQRVLVLPAPSFWAWDYHSWGYQGAGFMWFGIPQPFLSRDSDRWNPYNEQAYREISYAIAQNNWKLFYQLLEKYHIGWVVLDKTVITNGQDESILNLNRTEEFLASEDLFSQQIFSDQLAVYTNQNLQETQTDTLLIKPATPVSPPYFWHYHDQAFQDHGWYYTPNSSQGIQYPARELLTALDRLDTTTFALNEDTLKLKANPNQTYTYALGQTEAVSTELSIQRDQAGEYWLITRPLLPYTEENRDPFLTGIPLQIDQELPFFLSINERVFSVDKLGLGAEKILGTEHFLTNNQHNWRSYDPAQQDSFPIDLTIQDVVGYPCQLNTETNTPELIEPTISANGLQIEVTDQTICTQLSLPAETTQLVEADTTVLLELNFTAESASHLDAEVCIFESSSQTCLNRQTHFPLTDHETQRTVSLQVESTSSDLANLNILFVTEPSSNANSPDGTQLQSISQLQLNLLPTAASSEFEIRLPTEVNQPVLTAEEDGILYLPLTSARAEVSLADLPHQPDRCGSTAEAIINREINQNAVRYSAEYGQSCDRVVFETADQAQGYILAVTSRNLSGLPIRLCVQNLLTNRCDLYVPLTNSDTFETEFFVIPPMSRAGQGYSVNLVTLAPGSHPSINEVTKLELVPFSYNLAQSIQSEPDTQPELIATSPYSYQPGFIAGWSNGLSWKPVTEHVLVNNWANGWVISPEELAEAEKNDQTLMVLFWPHLLELAGLGLGLGTFSYLLVQPLLKRFRL